MTKSEGKCSKLIKNARIDRFVVGCCCSESWKVETIFLHRSGTKDDWKELTVDNFLDLPNDTSSGSLIELLIKQ